MRILFSHFVSVLLCASGLVAADTNKIQYSFVDLDPSSLKLSAVSTGPDIGYVSDKAFKYVYPAVIEVRFRMKQTGKLISFGFEGRSGSVVFPGSNLRVESSPGDEQWAALRGEQILSKNISKKELVSKCILTLDRENMGNGNVEDERFIRAFISKINKGQIEVQCGFWVNKETRVDSPWFNVQLGKTLVTAVGEISLDKFFQDR
jgi:hypothetical protein